jgi:hypothetical protein
MPMKTRPVHDFLTIYALIGPVKSYFIFDKAFNAISQLHILRRCDINAPGEKYGSNGIKIYDIRIVGPG